MSNPFVIYSIFTDKVKDVSSVYNQSINESSVAKMTTQGTLNKAFFLLLIVFLSGMSIWIIPIDFKITDGINIGVPILAIGVALTLIASYKPKGAYFLAPLVAIAQGLFLGLNSKDSPGFIVTVIFLSLIVAFLTLILQKYRILRVTNKYKKPLLLAVSTVVIYYLVGFIISIRGEDSFNLFGDSLGIFVRILMVFNLLIGILSTIAIVGVLAFVLIADFQTIENATKIDSPKYLEWFGALCLIITIVWLYFEILVFFKKLRSKRRSKRNHNI